MSSHTVPQVEKTVSLADPMKFCATLAKKVDAYEKKRRQVKLYFNGEETTKGAMGLMVNLTSVPTLFDFRVAVTGYETEEEGQKIAREVMDSVKAYLA